MLKLARENYNSMEIASMLNCTPSTVINNLQKILTKEELAEFMLSQDESGSNYLYKALQDPQTLVKAAWFILNGDEAFDNISEYFVNQIKLVSENQYKKGLEDGRKGVQSRPSVVINNRNTKSSRQQQTYSTLDDLDDED